MRLADEWFAVLCSACPWLLAGCLAFPLPDQGPERPEDWPTPGTTAERVTSVLGRPDLLDTPTVRVYEWSTDRRFVIGAVPTGVPVGGVFGGRRFRALVRFDAEGLAESVEVVPLLEHVENSGATLEVCYRLSSIPELSELDFFLEAGGTTTLSSEGDLLALTDHKKRVWVVDVGSRTAALAHTGGRSSWFSLFQTGPVRTAFSSSGDQLAVAQYRGTSALLGRDTSGRFGSPRPMDGEDLLAVAFETDAGPLFLDGDGGVRSGTAAGSSVADVTRTRLSLGRRGPVAKRPVPAAGLLVASVPGPGLQPDQVLVFDAGGRGLAVFDPRRAATGWGPPGLSFSPCGRWLARNSGGHVELWSCADVVGVLTGATTDAPAPAAVFVMAQAHLDEDWLEPAAALAFDRGSRWVAAATANSIGVWRLADGKRLASVGPLPIELDQYAELPLDIPIHALRVNRLALAPDGRLTALLQDYWNTLFLARWRLDDTSDGTP